MGYSVLSWYVPTFVYEFYAITHTIPQMNMPLTWAALHSLDRRTFDNWVSMAHGEKLIKCEVTDEQCSTVLHLALAFRAFARELHGVTEDHFEAFAMLLIDAYSTLDEHEPADEVLEDLVMGLHDILPQVSLHVCTTRCNSH